MTRFLGAVMQRLGSRKVHTSNMVNE
jgi:hypothetical protein